MPELTESLSIIGLEDQKIRCSSRNSIPVVAGSLAMQTYRYEENQASTPLGLFFVRHKESCPLRNVVVKPDCNIYG